MKKKRNFERLWGVITVMSVGITITFGIVQLFSPNISPQEMAELEQFLVESWVGLVTPTPDFPQSTLIDWFVLLNANKID